MGRGEGVRQSLPVLVPPSPRLAEMGELRRILGPHLRRKRLDDLVELVQIRLDGPADGVYGALTYKSGQTTLHTFHDADDLVAYALGTLSSPSGLAGLVDRERRGVLPYTLRLVDLPLTPATPSRRPSQADLKRRAFVVGTQLFQDRAFQRVLVLSGEGTVVPLTTSSPMSHTVTAAELERFLDRWILLAQRVRGVYDLYQDPPSRLEVTLRLSVKLGDATVSATGVL